MVGRNGLFSGYKSQRTKGQKGLEKKRLSLLCFFLKKQRRLKKKKDHELKKKKKKAEQEKKKQSEKPRKTEKRQHTEQKPEREHEPNKDYTERGIAFTIAFVPVDHKKPENKQGEKRKRNWGEKGELKENKTEKRRQWQCWWGSPSTLSPSSAIVSNRNQSISFFL
jgi:hypothetical protein